MATNLIAAKLRRVPFPFRAPTVPAGRRGHGSRATLGADYDTEWARTPRRTHRAGRPRQRGHASARLGARLATVAGPRSPQRGRRARWCSSQTITATSTRPLLLTSIPERWRHKVVVGAAADYFFGTRVIERAVRVRHRRHPDRAHEGRAQERRSRPLAHRRRLELADLPRGRTISPDGWGQPFRGGAAYIALRCGVPVVPIHLEGTGRILRKGGSLAAGTGHRHLR